MLKHALASLVLIFVMAMLTGCGEVPPTRSDDIDAAASVTAAVMTVVAEETSVPDTPTPEPTVTSTPPAATATPASAAPTDTPVPPTATSVPPTPTATRVPPTDVPACVTLQNVNLRPGPGLSYDPPIRLLSADAALVPLAFSAAGFPSGQWVQVRDDATGNEGWVSAGTQFVSCNFDVTALPPAASIPPTPTPLPTSTPQPPSEPAVSDALDVEVKAPDKGTVGGGDIIMSDDFLLRMRVWNKDLGGSNDGDGIDHVEFKISLNGNPIYSKRENNAGYCIFGGGEPTCNNWPMRDGRYVWGGDGPEVQPGTYHAKIIVIIEGDDAGADPWVWDFNFTVGLP